MKNWKKIVSLFAVTILLLWGVSIYVSLSCFEEKFNPVESINTLFSGLAFVAVAVTLFVQYQSLISQGADMQKLQKHYNDLVRAQAIAIILGSEQNIARRMSSGEETGEKKEIKEDLGSAILKYYWELKEILENKPEA